MTFTHKKKVNIYIVFEKKLLPYTQVVDFMLKNYLFWIVKWTKNADPGKYSYSTYGIGFDARGSFPLSDGSGFGKNLTILGADMSFNSW